MAARVPSPTDDARNLQAIMLRAMRRASAVVADPPGRTDRARKLAAARSAATMRDLRRDLSAMNAQANAILGRQLPAQFERGVRRADRLAKEAGLVRDDTPIGGALSGAETRRAAVLVRTKQADLNKAFTSIGSDNGIIGRAVRQARAIGLDQAKLRRILAGGAISGTGAQDLQQVRELMRSIGDGKIVEVVNKHGVVMEFDAQSYADMVYQTAMAEAANIAEVERLAARGNFYVEIIGSNSKNFCTAYVGRVFYTGDGEDPLGHFPSIRRVPRGGAPFHPRCSKRYVPFNPRTATPAQIQAAKPTPEVERLLDKSSNDAQRTFEAQQSAAGEVKKTALAQQPPPPDSSGPRKTPGMEKPSVNPSPIESNNGSADPAGRVEPSALLVAPGEATPAEKVAVRYVQQAAQSIGRVHKFPPSTRPVPLRAIDGLSNSDGQLVEGQVIVDRTGRPARLEVRTGIERPYGNAAHEFGHLLELTTVGKGGASTSPAFAEWHRLTSATTTTKRLVLNARRRRDRYSAYLIAPWEIFARSYAQWVGLRSGDGAIIRDVGYFVGTEPPLQWTAAEFDPIAVALDDAIRTLGLAP